MFVLQIANEYFNTTGLSCAVQVTLRTFLVDPNSIHMFSDPIEA